jgi:outer membrane immunogenic protein
MKKIALAAAAASLMFAGAASAADMAVKARPVAPPAVVYSWTGFYIGGNVGWAESEQTAYTVGTPAGFGAPAIGGAGIAGIGVLPMSHGLGHDSILGGVHAGYNWQAGNWVLGVEADASFIDRNITTSQPVLLSFAAPPQNAGPFFVSAHNDWLATVRGRLGYTWDRLMLYGTGGAAFTRTSYSTAYTSVGVVPAIGPLAANFSSDKVGFAVGGGLEWMVSPNWLLRAEYLYYRFEGTQNSMAVVSGTCTAAVGCAFNTNTGDLEFHTARVGVSYKFGGPVVAKY